MTRARSAETATIAPPPWRLTGRGAIVLLHCDAAFGNACAADQPGLDGKACGGLGTLMVVDYAHTDVGAYRELLLCPGRFEWPDRRRAPAVTHIWVSTQASVVNGRHHWGLPKHQAAFAVERRARHETYRIRRGDQSAVTLSVKAYGPALPATTRLLPSRWHTLDQPWQDRRYRTTVSAGGRMRWARLTQLDIPADAGFPALDNARILAALQIPRFRMIFPRARITPLTTAAD